MQIEKDLWVQNTGHQIQSSGINAEYGECKCDCGRCDCGIGCLKLTGSTLTLAACVCLGLGIWLEGVFVDRFHYPYVAIWILAPIQVLALTVHIACFHRSQLFRFPIHLLTYFLQSFAGVICVSLLVHFTSGIPSHGMESLKLIQISI
eukprot:TRINITY_DN9141_c0_g1_i1.p1 TRINITY_DN9141_c0_g1~~TRINITY_DN9141_c0_g1_i1.p1  ORF type:complete len:148 (-),score=10.56 TRINITY_DN9141_c0_g1_i1:328-771(-)